MSNNTKEPPSYESVIAETNGVVVGVGEPKTLFAYGCKKTLNNLYPFSR